MQNSPTIAGFIECNGGKLEMCFQMCFGHLMCVRIEIDLL